LEQEAVEQPQVTLILVLKVKDIYHLLIVLNLLEAADQEIKHKTHLLLQVVAVEEAEHQLQIQVLQETHLL
jgi:predicted protein tyrosine phosphatase